MSRISYTVTLPDGRKCKAIVTGRYYQQTWDEPSSFDLADNDALEAEWVDGEPLTEEEMDEFADYIIDEVISKGEFIDEEWD